ncbi:MAG: class I SAM-dependent RNA methyltransferase [Burkholderiaceae bacterium]|nr:class I SAM-dependent RNA methyltransferase [Microbacteriaceae bacterium]
MGDMQGTRVQVEITGVAHGGIFVARHEGRVVFVGDAIPGETVIAEITDDSKSAFWRADTVEVVEASPHRQGHVWEAASLENAPADRAGGAEFGHIDLAHQRELKRRVIAESLSRMARIELPVEVEALPAGDATGGLDNTGTGWRTRVRLHVDADGVAGPFAARSHRVIPVRDLPLAVRESDALTPLDGRYRGADFLDIIVPSIGEPIVVASSGVAKVGKTAGKPAARPAPTRGSNTSIVERVGDREFSLDLHGFWQVHRHAAQTLTTAVQQAIDEHHFEADAANLDLYGGVGLLAAAVGDRFGSGVRITTVESDPLATAYATANLADLPGAVAETGRVERYLQRLRTGAGTVERARLERATIVLDPPRSGAGKAVVGELAAFAPRQIVYVACDPVALARDIALFAERGYVLSRLRAFDLFPHTHHVEAVATLVRA